MKPHKRPVEPVPLASRGWAGDRMQSTFSTGSLSLRRCCTMARLSETTTAARSDGGFPCECKQEPEARTSTALMRSACVFSWALAPCTASFSGNNQVIRKPPPEMTIGQDIPGIHRADYMINPEELEPYLLHEDEPVRNAVVEYFADKWHQDEGIVPMILQACDRWGGEENMSGLHACRRFPITEQAFLDLVARSSSMAETTGMAGVNVSYHLNQAIATAPVGLLLKHETALLENPHQTREAMDFIQHRREFAGWSAQQLWEELQDYARRSEEKKNANDINHAYVDTLVEALAPCDVPDAATLCTLLKSPDNEHSWLEIFLIDLAGERRVHETIAILVDKFRIDTDYMLERCSEALAKIGDPEAVRLIRNAFPNESWSYRLYTSSLLGKIKVQESEDAIIALLESESDTTIRTNLCLGLCKLFSRRGVDVVRQEIRTQYDSSLVELEEELLPVAHILGIDLPEADEWRQKREEREQFRAQQQQELGELGKKYFALKEQGIDPFAKLGSPPHTPQTSEATTYRHHDARVGRNDPCPCGSGKKHKKCCGRK